MPCLLPRSRCSARLSTKRARASPLSVVGPADLAELVQRRGDARACRAVRATGRGSPRSRAVGPSLSPASLARSPRTFRAPATRSFNPCSRYSARLSWRILSALARSRLRGRRPARGHPGSAGRRAGRPRSPEHLRGSPRTAPARRRSRAGRSGRVRARARPRPDPPRSASARHSGDALVEVARGGGAVTLPPRQRAGAEQRLRAIARPRPGAAASARLSQRRASPVRPRWNQKYQSAPTSRRPVSASCRIGRLAQCPGQRGAQIVQVGLQLVPPLLLRRARAGPARPRRRAAGSTRRARAGRPSPRRRPPAVPSRTRGSSPASRSADRRVRRDPLQQALVDQPGDDVEGTPARRPDRRPPRRPT